MPQDKQRKLFYEQTAKAKSQARAESLIEHEIDDVVLQGDQHTGQQGIIGRAGGALPPNEEALHSPESKEVYDLLPEMTTDEWRRVRLVPRGERLKTGGVYFDLRFPDRGELVATGEETVGDSDLLIAKKEIDFVIWGKLVGRNRVAGYR